MNKYIYYCNHCSFKRVINGSSDLDGFIIVKSSPIQTKIPQIDQVTGNKREPKSISQPKRIKCPNCGFSNRPKVLKEEEKSE